MRNLLLTTAVLCSTSLLAQVPPAPLDTAALLREDSLYRAERGKYFAHIEVRAHYDGKVVRLRWAPDAAGGWLNTNQMGYNVERVDLGAIGDKEPVSYTHLTLPTSDLV